MAIRNDLSVLRAPLTVLAGGGLAKPTVIAMPSPNQSARPGGPGDIDTIVLHHTATAASAQDVGKFFQDPKAKVSAHYTVGKDGIIVQSVSDADKSWHAGRSEYKGRDNVNDFSIGIEIANLGDGKDPYTDKQYDALADLVAWLMKTYSVPMERITGHKDIALPAGRKTDPSANFDLPKLEALVSERLKGASGGRVLPTPPVGDHWIYAVKAGDTLMKIAREQLGDANRWPEIYGLNHDTVRNPDLIFPGQQLRMPARRGTPTPSPYKPNDPPVVLRPEPPAVNPRPTEPPSSRPTPPPIHDPIRPTPPPVRPVPPGQDSFDLGRGARLASPVLMNYLRSGASLNGGFAGGFMNGGGGIFRGGAELIDGAGGLMGGGASGVMRGGFLSGLKDAVPRLLKSNFLVAAVFSAVSNGLDLVRGRVTGKQAAAGFAVDTVAYTGIGAASTYLGGLVGSFLGPVGTIGGILVGSAIGIGLGWLYEKFARSQAVSALGQLFGR